MALPALEWRMLPPVPIASTAQTSFILDAIYTAGTSSVYADGSLRVRGSYAAPNVGQVPLAAGPTLPVSGFAWTWNYDATTKSTFAGEKTACYAVPASGALSQKIIVMGINTAAVPGATWKQYIDARNAGYMYAGVAKNSGLYTTFDSATTPFTAGDFTGFGLITNQMPIPTATLLYMWECAEAVFIQIRGSTGAVSGALMGAWIDPLSTNALNAESDGRLYGLATSGTATFPATWLSSSSAGSFFLHSAASGDQHVGTFTPGAGTITNVTRLSTFTPSFTFTSRNGDLPEIPYQFVTATGNNFIGQARQIYVTRDSPTGIAWEALGVSKGYLVGASAASALDAIVLAY